jgi:hypothetical protein
MRNFLLLSFISLSFFSVKSQPQFTSSNCFQVNDSSKIGFAIVSQNFDDYISQTGSNYTWDFTNAGTPGPWTSWTNPTVSYRFQPSSQSSHTPFLSTEINEYALLSFSRDHFYTYSANQDTLYFNGLYTSSNYAYTPGIPYLNFPLSFSDSVYTNTNLFVGAIQTGSATRYWIYDGFGTLKLPYGTEQNVYRIRTKQIDSSSVLNTVLATYDEIIWFSQSTGIPLLRFLKNGTFISAYYCSTSGSPAALNSMDEDKAVVYPNPFENNILVKNHSNNEIEYVRIFDINKRLLLEEKQVAKINTEKLVPGIYFIEIKTNENINYRNKIIKN